MPSQINCDQGRNFESKLFIELTKLAGIRKTQTAPFHPRSDGQTERMNRTILGMLRATVYDYPENWPAKLPAILAACRMTLHSTTGVTLNYAMLAREVRLPCAAPPEEPSQNSVSYNLHFRDSMRMAHERVRNATKQSAKTQKSYFDARIRAISFTKGQLVWLYWPKPLLRQQKRKLTHLWFGPYRIVDFKSEVVVQKQHIKTDKLQVVHIDRLLPCTTVPEISSPHTSHHRTQSPSFQSSYVPESAREHQVLIIEQTSNVSIPVRRSQRTHRRPSRYDY